MKFEVTGMTCAACSTRIEKVVSSLPEVENCQVNLLTGTMVVNFKADDATLTPNTSENHNEHIFAQLNTRRATLIQETVKKAGYSARPLHHPGAAPQASLPSDNEYKKIRTRLLVSLILLTLLLLLPKLLQQNTWSGQNLTKPVQLLLTISIMAINFKFFSTGVKGLLHGSPNMDTLVATGALASFIYGSYDGTAMILTLITIGKTLEIRAKGKTTNAIKSLISLTPKTVTILENWQPGKQTTENQKEIDIEQIKTGDIFIVKPGQNIPVDGIVLDGHSSVNEASITGESVPVDKSAQTEQTCTVTAGTTNLDGVLICRATRVGQDTTIAQIIRLVSDSAATKAPVQKIADKVSAVFVPVVMGIALVTFIIWLLLGKDTGFALMRGISVLVISCPCALGLATPVAIMVGNGLGAKEGILFKTSAALELTGKAATVVMDKTGTITKGQLIVTEVQADNATGITSAQILEIARALEQNSTHPVARAICQTASASSKERAELDNNSTTTTDHTPLSFHSFRELPGQGVTALSGTDEYFCGKTAASNKVCVTRNGKIIGKITIEDSIKEDSAAAIAQMQKLNLKTVMLTGDNSENTKKIIEQLNDGSAQKVLLEYYAGLLPNQKAAEIEKLKKNGLVIMVGDGINDAPSLTAADVGIAIGAGSDIAIESAGIVLVKNSLADVVNAIILSRRVLRTIKQNLFWAFFYNTLAIPVAAGCFISLGLQLTPALSSACMSLSSLCVVLNALRLRLKK